MASAKYRILVTNDDGVESSGLGVLARHLADAGHDVVVAAPMVEMSGSGAAVGGIMPGDTLATEQVQLPDAAGVAAFSVDGAPGRCVLAAMLGAFGPLPELVVSGINPGANVGRFLQLHSGTLGAALTSAQMGVNGMAVSIEPSVPTHWDTAAIVATRLVDYLASCERRTTLNLNLPDVAIDQVKGLRNAPVGSGSAARLVLDGSAPGVMSMDFVPIEPRPDRPAPGVSDRSLVDDGYAVITRVLPPQDVAPETLPDDIV
ncbi:MAG: 5'/3'-nucleotidase SurE [Ilumatobacter sp.]